MKRGVRRRTHNLYMRSISALGETIISFSGRKRVDWRFGDTHGADNGENLTNENDIPTAKDIAQTSSDGE